jgi:hypothetical protein
MPRRNSKAGRIHKPPSSLTKLPAHLRRKVVGLEPTPKKPFPENPYDEQEPPPRAA